MSDMRGGYVTTTPYKTIDYIIYKVKSMLKNYLGSDLTKNIFSDSPYDQGTCLRYMSLVSILLFKKGHKIYSRNKLQARIELYNVKIIYE